MTAKRLSDEELLEALALVEQHGTVSEAARHTELRRSTFESRVARARDRFGKSEKLADTEEVELPTFPNDDIEVEEILDHLSKRWEKRQEHEQAKIWFDIKIKSDDVFGLAVVGDPHLGSQCNFSLLRRDVEIMSSTPGIHCVNIGDTTNNWAGYGRLSQLYAEEDMSRPTERKLARGFLEACPWGIWLDGNHDQMAGELSVYLRSQNVKQIPMLDWQAKFQLVFPSATVRVDASHNHKGTSIFNPLHGQKRAALWGEDADIFVAGHHHTWAIQQQENAGGRCVTYARARGYKWHDEYAHRHGFNEERYGSTIIYVIDPKAPPNTRVKPFADLEEGAEFLTWKRGRK